MFITPTRLIIWINVNFLSGKLTLCCEYYEYNFSDEIIIRASTTRRTLRYKIEY